MNPTNNQGVQPAWWKFWARRNPKPCDCDNCTGRQPNCSTNPNVSHGLDIWVAADGTLHQRSKSRFVR